jgi:hypothetical protein
MAVKDPEPIKPENDPSRNPAGARTYEEKSVRPRPQGPNPAGASEPGDMGSPETADYEQPPGENPGPDSRGGYRGA